MISLTPSLHCWSSSGITWFTTLNIRTKLGGTSIFFLVRMSYIHKIVKMILAKWPLDGSWSLLCKLASTWNKSASGCTEKSFLWLHYFFIWQTKPWSVLHAGKASLGFVKSTDDSSAEEMKNVCLLSSQNVLIADSTCAYFAVITTYLFAQVWKLPLWIVASQEKKHSHTFP